MRLAARALGVFIATGLTLAVLSPWFDILVGNYVPMLQALIVVSLIATLLCFLIALATRRRFFLVAFVVPLLAAVPAVFLLTKHSPIPDTTRTQAGQHHLTVFSLNCEFGQVDVASAEKAISHVHPDVVILVEMNPRKLRLLDDGGLAKTYPYRSTGLVDNGAKGSVILAKYPVTTVSNPRNLGRFDLQWPIATLHAPGQNITMRAIHTYPPLRDGVAVWRPRLAELGTWQRDTNGPLIMAGDFNASTAHPVFRAMERGLTDDYSAVHSSWMPTWPHGDLMPPFTQIDHILSRNFVPEHAGVITVKGTDHAAIWAQLRY